MRSYTELVGLTIGEAKRKLGYWWVCTSTNLDPLVGCGTYCFTRSPGGCVQLTTNRKNVVISEHHNGYADFLLKRDNRKKVKLWQQ